MTDLQLILQSYEKAYGGPFTPERLEGFIDAHIESMRRHGDPHAAAEGEAMLKALGQGASPRELVWGTEC